MARKGQRRRLVEAVLNDVAASLDGVERPVLRRLMPALVQAQNELQVQLKQWLARDGGEGRFTTQRYRNALASVRRAWKTVKQLHPAMEAGLWDAAERVGSLSTANLELELAKFAHVFEGSVFPVSIDPAVVIARGDKMLIDRFASSAAKYAGGVRDDVIRELAVSRVKSETMFEVANRLQKRIPQVFEGQRFDALRLARTETMNAYNVFHVEGLKLAKDDDPEIVSRWDASYDWRRCPMCASLDGQIRDVAEGEKFVAEWTSLSKRKGPRRHRRVIEQPPAHPQCRCVITPWRSAWPEYARGAEVANPVDDRKLQVAS